VESNRLFEAQAIMLEQLEGQFGGAAKPRPGDARGDRHPRLPMARVHGVDGPDRLAIKGVEAITDAVKGLRDLRLIDVDPGEEGHG
jgi:hypothetical protein